MGTVLNIRGIPDELVKRVKIRAIDSGMTLREFVIQCLEQEVAGLVALNPEETRKRVRKGKAGSPAEGAKSVQAQLNTSQLAARGETKATASGPAEVFPSKKFEMYEQPNYPEPYCKTHKKRMKDFGSMWLCEGPPQHKELK